jgi:hypothetical protein
MPPSVGVRRRRRARAGRQARTPSQGAAGQAPHEASTAPDGVHRQDFFRLSERVLLRRGDRIRVSGGLVWEHVDADGKPVRMRLGERGVMVFEEYCEHGASRWIVARGQSGYAALHLGPSGPSSLLPGLVRSPYKIRKLRKPGSEGGSRGRPR